ncbi:MAG: hypothetical protein IJL26_10140 [Clostridia bacterium]|nr:hypothetical protein [Clostridia bacterium]
MRKSSDSPLAGKNRITKTDLAAAALWLLTAAWFLYACRRGINFIDESFWYTIPHRLSKGDRLLVDEWQVSQFASVLQYLPFRLFTAVTGGTEGVILWMRYVFIAVHLTLSAFLYIKMRRYGAAGLLGTALFTVFLPGGYFALSYTTMEIHGFLVLTALLCLGGKEPSRPTLVLSGVVLSGVVLAEPLAALLYLLFSALVLLRTLADKRGKKLFSAYGFLVNGRLWLWMSLGVLLCAVPFTAWLAVRSGIGNIVAVFPQLFTDAEYDFDGGGQFMMFLSKFPTLAVRYGVVPIIGALAVCCAVPILKKRGALNPCVRRRLFFAACAMFAAGLICGAAALYRNIRHTDLATIDRFFYYYCYFSAPADLFTLACYLLCEKKNRNVFLFWWCGLATTLLRGYSSDVQLCSSPLSSVAMPVVLAQLLRELKRTQPNRERKAAPRRTPERAAAAVCCALALLYGWISLWIAAFYPPTEKYINQSDDRAVCAQIDRGPFRGLYTTRRIKTVYDLAMEDLDEIRADCDGPVYIAGDHAYYYLYLDLPYSTLSGWYKRNDSWRRQEVYWQLIPEKQPEYVYVPKYDCIFYDPIEEFDDPEYYIAGSIYKSRYYADRFGCAIRDGKAGYFLKTGDGCP